MSESYRGVARDPWLAQGLGCLWGAAAVVGVVVAMNGWLLASGEAMTPSLEGFVRWSLPVGIPLGVALAVTAGRMTVTSRIEVTVGPDRDGAMRLQVGAKVDEVGGFVVDRGWDRVVGGRGLKLLWCDVERDGVLLVRFSTEVGALVPPPTGWPEAAPPMSRPAKHGGFVVDDVAKLAEALSA